MQPLRDGRVPDGLSPQGLQRVLLLVYLHSRPVLPPTSRQSIVMLILHNLSLGVVSSVTYAPPEWGH
jgi:hypothetical protein